MKFILLVEGKTEKKVLRDFLGRWLNERLDQRVGIKPDRIVGMQDLLKKASKYLNDPDSDDYIAVIGLLDLHGFNEIARGGKSANEFYLYAVGQIMGKLKDPKFLMFFAIYELEAWLLSQPNILPQNVGRALPSNANSPETIDFDEPPAKLLNRLYKSKLHKKYRKNKDGSVLFSKLDPQIAYDKCPHLAEMLDSMLSLAHEALA